MFEYNPTPKPSHNRKNNKRGIDSRFSSKVIQDILERDNHMCVRCGSSHIESVPHHVIFRSQMGKGTIDNGVTVCRMCHDWAHVGKEGRKWFEEYRIKYLLGGNDEKLKRITR